MSREHEWEAEEAQLAGLVQQALRQDTPPGLSPEQRARVSAAANASNGRRLVAVCAGLVMAAACGALVWFEHAHEQERARVERAALEAVEQLAEEQRQKEREQTELRLAGERARRAQDEQARTKASALAEPSESSGGAHSKARSSPRVAAKAAAAGKASSAPAPAAVKDHSASGGCDPNDALCGL